MVDKFKLTSHITHWFPIITFCPVNNLPDFIYVTIEFEMEFVELYEVRKKLRKEIMWSNDFMETVAQKVTVLFPTAKTVTVELMFGKHKTIVERILNEEDTNAR